jgi:nucleotide-binding universal stress UspA family protein
MASVLVGVDRSDGARAACIMGRWLADRLGLRLVLLHACDESPSPYGDAVHRERMQHLSGRKAMAVLHSVGPDDAERLVGSGNPADALIDFARDEAAAFIVVGSRGHGAVKSAFSHSVSRALARQAECPVVVVPPPAFERVLRLEGDSTRPAVVCGLDGSDGAGRTASAAAELSGAGDLALTLVQARSESSGFDSSFRGVPHSAAVLVASGSPVEVLKRIAQEQNAALIAIGASRRGRIARAAFGSVSASLAATAPCPVLIVPPGVDSLFGHADAGESRRAS